MRNETRSSNGELAEGMSDGLYKKVETDRGGVVGSETWESRRHLSQRDYVETPTPLLGLSAW
jgi:hypothetical protein